MDFQGQTDCSFQGSSYGGKKSLENDLGGAIREGLMFRTMIETSPRMSPRDFHQTVSLLGGGTNLCSSNWKTSPNRGEN